MGHDVSVGGWRAAQAVEFVRALRDQLRGMTTQLAWVEHQDVTGSTSRASRMEAAELRRDIREARALIDQLQRRYLNGHASAPTRNPTQLSSSSSGGSGRW